MKEPIMQKVILAENEKEMLEILRTSENPEETYLMFYNAFIEYLNSQSK